MGNFELTKRTLYPGKIRSILYLLAMLAFVVIGIVLITKGDSMGWVVAGVFGLGMLVFVANLLPQASYLVLDDQGFEVCSLFRKHRYRWEDVSYFGVGIISHNKMVMFNFSESYQKAKKARKISSLISGAEGALHDTFGMKAEALAELMNAYKMEFSISQEPEA